MRQGLLVSNTITYGDFHIVHITHMLSAVKTEGLSAANLFAFAITSADNPSIVGSASCCNRCSPLHKGAKCDSASSELSSNYNIIPLFARHTLCSLALILGSPLQKGANCDTSFSHVALNLNSTKTQCQSERTHVTSSTISFSNSPPTAVTTIIHHSSFIIHYIKSPPSFQTTDLDIE